MRSPATAQAQQPWTPAPAGPPHGPLPESRTDANPAAATDPDAAGTAGDPAGVRPAPPAAVWQFPALPVHARMARIWLEAWIADRGPGQDAAYRAAVAFSELVTNAVLHGAGPVTVRALVEPDRIECEVADGARDLPVVYQAREDDEHHRGLSLVEALTTSWRVRPCAEGGKAVTFVVEA